jgi:hypothetical protein
MDAHRRRQPALQSLLAVHYIYYAVQPCCQMWMEECRTSEVKCSVINVNGVYFITFLFSSIKFITLEIKFSNTEVNCIFA